MATEPISPAMKDVTQGFSNGILLNQELLLIHPNITLFFLRSFRKLCILPSYTCLNEIDSSYVQGLAIEDESGFPD